jgi:hypothetical protein
MIYKYIKYKSTEHYSGAWTQLYAKGPEDNYLTVGTEQYAPKYSTYYWKQYPYMWNVPNRTNLYPGYYPYYWYYDDNLWIYPYSTLY